MTKIGTHHQITTTQLAKTVQDIKFAVITLGFIVGVVIAYLIIAAPPAHADPSCTGADWSRCYGIGPLNPNPACQWIGVNPWQNPVCNPYVVNNPGLWGGVPTTPIWDTPTPAG